VLKPKALFLTLTAVSLAGVTLAGDAIPNWRAPAAWSPAKTRGLSAKDVTNPLPFIGLAPCRIVDTRGGAPITGGIFTGGSDVRSYALAGICGIPAAARALSLNFTVTGPGQTSAGFLLAWPTGGAVPPVSILNWDHVPAQIANAAVVPTDSSVSFTVNVSSPTHVIIDVNGYYSDAFADPTRQFAINNASSLPAISGINSSTTCTGGCGILGETGSTSGAVAIDGFAYATGAAGINYGVRGISASVTDGSAGVFGNAAASTGIVFGVIGAGSSPSNGAAGVLGYDQARSVGVPSIPRTGLRGESQNGAGVIGLSNAGVATSGLLYSTTGTLLASGLLGSAAGPQGVSYTGGLGGSGTKMFFEPHPTDPTKMIRYVSLEGPEAGTYFRGTARTIGGVAAIEVPETFRIVTDEEGLTVQVTPTGSKFTMMTVESADLNSIVVRSSRDIVFHYLVQGVRRAYKDFEVVSKNTHFVPESPDARIWGSLSPIERQRLIDNGTYNPDGTVNMQTAERAGWAAAWRSAAEEAKRKPEP